MTLTFKTGDIVTPTKYVGNAGPGDIARVRQNADQNDVYVNVEWIRVAKNHQNDGQYYRDDFVHLDEDSELIVLKTEVQSLRDKGYTVEVTITPPQPEAITL